MLFGPRRTLDGNALLCSRRHEVVLESPVSWSTVGILIIIIYLNANIINVLKPGTSSGRKQSHSLTSIENGRLVASSSPARAVSALRNYAVQFIGPGLKQVRQRSWLVGSPRFSNVRQCHRKGQERREAYFPPLTLTEACLGVEVL